MSVEVQVWFGPGDNSRHLNFDLPSFQLHLREKGKVISDFGMQKKIQTYHYEKHCPKKLPVMQLGQIAVQHLSVAIMITY